MTAPAQRGDLRELPLPRLLLEIERSRASGTLSLERGELRKQAELRDGAPVMVTSSRPSEGLVRFLAARGLLDAPAVERVKARIGEGVREVAAIAELRTLGPRELLTALRDHARALLLDCFGWTDGRFELILKESSGAAAKAARLDVCDLVIEGVASRWSPERILADVGPVLARRWHLADAASPLAHRLAGRSDVAPLLVALDGSRTLSEAIRGASHPRALAAAWLLHAAGALCEASAEAGPASTDSGAAAEPVEDAPEFEIVVSDAARPTPADAGADAAPGRAANRSAGDADALRREIEEKAAQLDALDHYALLGIGRDARPGMVKRAYFAAAKRFHPDLLSRLGLDDLKPRASEVFARMVKAYEVLSDLDRRREYDASLDGGTGDDDAAAAARLVQAETLFRKGEILLRAGKFAEAVEFLRPAAELWPEDATYQASLGWALFRGRCGETKDALAPLERALEVDPDHADAHHWIGAVLRALGRTADADRMQARGRELARGRRANA